MLVVEEMMAVVHLPVQMDVRGVREVAVAAALAEEVILLLVIIPVREGIAVGLMAHAQALALAVVAIHMLAKIPVPDFVPLEMVVVRVVALAPVAI